MLRTTTAGTRAIVGVLAAVLATTVLSVGPGMAPPAQAAVRYYLYHQTHPPGFPSPGTPPAQTLEYGRAVVVDDEDPAVDRTSLEVVAVFEDEPTADTDAALRIDVGHLVDGACVTQWTLTTSTYQPTSGAERDGTALRYETDSLGALPPDSFAGGPCSTLTLTAPGGAVVDQLISSQGGITFLDPISRVDVVAVRAERRVRVRRPTTLWVQVAYYGSEGTGLIVEVQGQGVAGGTAEFNEFLHTGNTLWLPVEVSLLRQHRVEVRVSALGPYIRLPGATQTVVLKPERRRASHHHGWQPRIATGSR